jgi:calcineurin-like phosphoesterase family protein
MTNIWVSSDHHFGHRNILNFKRRDGITPLRPFADIDEMHETMIARHNAVVRPQDHVYFLGDFAINKGGLKFLARMNGHKRLVRGNHDIFKTREYIEAGFDEIYGVRVWPKHNLIFSHIPLHPHSLSSRDWINVHGHTHDSVVVRESISGEVPDVRYRCVCVEQIDYTPVLLME